LTRTAVAVSGIAMVSFLGKVDIIISGVFTAIFVALLIKLSIVKK
jgi:hypothetical protein